MPRCKTLIQIKIIRTIFRSKRFIISWFLLIFSSLFLSYLDNPSFYKTQAQNLLFFLFDLHSGISHAELRALVIWATLVSHLNFSWNFKSTSSQTAEYGGFQQDLGRVVGPHLKCGCTKLQRNYQVRPLRCATKELSELKCVLFAKVHICSH